VDHKEAFDEIYNIKKRKKKEEFYGYLVHYAETKIEKLMSDYKQKVNNSIQQLQLGD